MFKYLADIISNSGRRLFFESWFHIPTIWILECKNMFAVGTVRVNRFANPPLPPDFYMKKKERIVKENCKQRKNSVEKVIWL